MGTVDGYIERLATAVLLVGPTQGETAELFIDVKSAPQSDGPSRVGLYHAVVVGLEVVGELNAQGQQFISQVVEAVYHFRHLLIVLVLRTQVNLINGSVSLISLAVRR